MNPQQFGQGLAAQAGLPGGDAGPAPAPQQQDPVAAILQGLDDIKAMLAQLLGAGSPQPPAPGPQGPLG